MSALGRPGGAPHGARSTPSPWVQTAKALRHAGVIVREIAHRLGVSKSAVSKWLTRLDKPTMTSSVAATAENDAGRVASAQSLDKDPKYRVLDRLLARLPKAHVTQMRMSLPATTDYWVNDKHGDPLFVVTAEFNEGLVQMLPVLLKEVRALVGPRRRVTVVFDRGGWSPKLFAKLIEAVANTPRAVGRTNLMASKLSL